MAIAFDAVANSTTSFSGTGSYSHTCTGTNLILVLSLVFANNVNATTSSPTYNGVAMTQAATFTGNAKVQVWYLVNPATGSHTVSIPTNAGGGANVVTAETVSLTGVSQTSPIGATGTGTTASGSSISASVTTTTPNSYLVDSASTFSSGSPSLTATGTNQTSRNGITYSSSNNISGQSTETTTSVGSYAVSYSTHSLSSNDILAVEILPLPITRTPSDSIMNGASRVITLSYARLILRSFSDSLMNAVSRLTTLSFFLAFQPTQNTRSVRPVVGVGRKIIPVIS